MRQDTPRGQDGAISPTYLLTPASAQRNLQRLPGLKVRVKTSGLERGLRGELVQHSMKKGSLTHPA